MSMRVLQNIEFSASEILRRAAAIVAVAVFLTGCNTNRTSSKSIVYVDPAKGVEVVQSGAGSILGMGDHEPGLWVDSRNPEEFEAAHIVGAINIPFQFVTRDQDQMRGYGAVVVYGRGYNDPRAEGMTKRMLDLGFENVHLLRGGIRAWINENRPVEGTEVDAENADGESS